MRYAIVEDSIITNMIELNPMNANNFPNAVYAEEWSIRIGDSYNSEDGLFYRDGKRILSDRERMYELEVALALLTGEAETYYPAEE